MSGLVKHPCGGVALAEARDFLEFLGPGARFTFQTFDDGKEKRNRLTKMLHGSFDDVAKDLERLNQEGAGIFVTVNETDLKGRTKGNVRRVRALFVDLDGAPLDGVKEFPLEPNIVIETSSGRWHCYWIVSNIDLSDFSAFQKKLAERFKGDPVVHDLPRVMRLPGFFHRKGEPFLTRLIAHTEGSFTRADFVRALNFDPVEKPEKTKESDIACTDELAKATAFRLASSAAERTHKQPSLRRHGAMLQLGYDCRREGLSEEAANHAALVFFNLARDTDSDGELRPLEEKEVLDAVLNAYREGKEDLLDTSIKLAEPTDKYAGGARFTVSFTKTRGKCPQPDSIEVELIHGEEGKLVWAIDTAAPVPKWAEALKLVQDEQPATQKKLAGIMGISEAAVGKHLKKAREKGFLEGLALTEKGERYVERIAAEERF